MHKNGTGKLSFRKPDMKDGGAVWELVRDSGKLDLNSAYSYLMLCDMFRDTCCVALHEGQTAGFVSAFRKPGDSETLFIWQIGVAAELRGRGVGNRLLKELLTREENADIRYLEATISPGNEASRQLFLRLAHELGGTCLISAYYGADLFPGTTKHDEEQLFRIGPIKLDWNMDQLKRMEEIGK